MSVPFEAMNNNRREENRGGGRKRRGGAKRGGGGPPGDKRGGTPSREKDGEQRSGNSRQENNPHAAGGESGNQRERRNARGSSGRGQRARDNARNASQPVDLNAHRNSGSNAGSKNDASSKEKKRLSKAAQEELLRLEKEENERLEAERLEAERLAAEKKEEERKEAERKEAERKEAERKEREENAAKAAELSEKRRVQRELNLSYCGESPSTSRISETELRKLDSSLKKCTGFLRKLRGSGITEDSHKSLISDVRTLNLSRYIQEVVGAIAETKLRSSDTEYAAILCSELHQRFEDFAAELSGALSSVVLSTHANAGKDLAGRRGAMRLLVELFVLGMYPDIGAVVSVLRELMKSVRDSRDAAVANLSVVASFVRAVSRFLLVQTPPASQNAPRTLSWEDHVASMQTKQTITAALDSYYKGEVIKLYTDAKDELRKAEHATLRARQTKGCVDDACAAKHDEAFTTCERIYSACGTLASALGCEPPIPVTKLADEMETAKARAREGGSGISVVGGSGSNARYRDTQGEQDAEELFDSVEEQCFYVDFSNVGPRSSDAALNPSNKKSEGPPGDNGKTKSNSTLSNEGANHKLNADSSLKGDSEKPDKPEKSEKSSGRSRRKNEKNPSLDNLLARLGATETKENADRFTNQFINVAESSRNPTKRLSKSLIAVSPQKLNVLPAYARIAASLRGTYPEVSQSVGSSLEEEFKFLAGRTDVDEKSLASCIKTARYLGEYVKFRMVDFGIIFSLLAMCMKDFSGHRVDIACHLLETCGRFIYRTPASSLRMGNLLDTVWRLKSVKNLEARHNTLVETAFFAAKPASGVRLQRRKERPPLQEYIRRLIYVWLTPETVRWTAQQMKRLPWSDDLQDYVIKKFVKVSSMRFSTIPEVALLISYVGKYRKEVLVGVVDGILESIRAGMERNDGRDSQRRVSEVALLGELYNSHVISEAHVFLVLYQFISLGHEVQSGSNADRAYSAISPTSEGSAPPDGQSEAGTGESPVESGLDFNAGRSGNSGFYQSAPDPPKDFFRIRLTSTLIETCGSGLFREKRRKMQVFWAFFERYVFCKAGQAGLGEQLPLHVDHIVDDAFERMTRLEAPTGALHGRESSRRVLSENSSRIRIRSRESEKRERRASQAKAEEAALKINEQWVRSPSLEDALQRVDEIEKNPLDLVLVTLPIRSVVETPVHESVSPNATSSPKAVSPHPEELNKTSPSLRNDLQDSGISSPNKLSGRKSKSSEVESSSENNVTSNRSADHSDSFGEEELDDENTSVSDAELSDYDEEDELASGAHDSELDRGFDDELDSDDLDDEDEDEDEEDEDDEDEDDVILEKSQGPKTGEEEAFERELAALTAAAVQSARESPSRLTTLDRMAIPMGLMAQKVAADRAAAAAAAAALNGANSDVGAKSPGGRWDRKKRAKENRVEFKFLVRKGGKSQIQDLSVPATSSLAVAAKESENAEAAEQEEKKRLVLESSIVVNGDDDDSLDRVVPLRTQQDARAKEQSIKEQRSADEMALLSTLFKPKPRR